jgi:NAD(P)-dependent dehydrogenase (short-subunit alcohol dehydrogenase family)/acyl carrier protein
LKRAAARDLRYPAARLRPDASYLVTGGLTGLGLETAGWLVEHGARHLVLTGRRAAGESAQAAIAEWSSVGVTVACVQADIGDAADADRLFRALEELAVPLRGVIHSAGSLDDAALLQQDWPRFQRVLKAKVDGAWNLHLRTRSIPLDFFVLYSSGASLLGSVGQANHAAANAFLDGLAIHRRSCNLTGLSIHWGAWREVGAAVRHDVLDRIAQSGVNSIDIRGGLRALECLLASGAARAAVLPIDWTRFAVSGVTIGRSTLFAGLQRDLGKPVAAAIDPAVASRNWREKLQAAAPPRRRSIVQDLVDREAGKILGLKSSQPIDPRQPLQELGLDSLMAVQFRNTLAAWIGIELPPTLLYNCPTVDELTTHLVDNLAAREQPALPQAAESAQPSETDLDDISEEELARMLEDQIKLA